MKLRRLNSQRGAAFVESLIAISFCLLAFAAMIFVNRAYGSKLGTMRDARASTLAHAIVGCTRPLSGYPSTGDGPSSSSHTSTTQGYHQSAAPSTSPQAQAALGDSHVANGILIDIASTSRAGKESGGNGAGVVFSADVTSTSHIACAEKVTDESIFNIARRALGALGL